MKASDLFVKAPEKEGVDYIFGIPGEENLDFLEWTCAGALVRAWPGHAATTGAGMGAVLGAYSGSKIALALPEHGLRIIFGILLVALGLHYLHASRHPHKPLPVSEWKPSR